MGLWSLNSDHFLQIPQEHFATTKQQRSLTATMHHPSAATHLWHWQLCLLDHVNKLKVAVPPGNWSQVQTNGQYFAPELFIPTDAVKTAGGQWALRKCTAGLWIPPNGRICDWGEKCEEQACRCNVLQGEDIFLQRQWMLGWRDTLRTEVASQCCRRTSRIVWSLVSKTSLWSKGLNSFSCLHWLLKEDSLCSKCCLYCLNKGLGFFCFSCMFSNC